MPKKESVIYWHDGVSIVKSTDTYWAVCPACVGVGVTCARCDGTGQVLARVGDNEPLAYPVDLLMDDGDGRYR